MHKMFSIRQMSKKRPVSAAMYSRRIKAYDMRHCCSCNNTVRECVCSGGFTSVYWCIGLLGVGLEEGGDAGECVHFKRFESGRMSELESLVEGTKEIVEYPTTLIARQAIVCGKSGSYPSLEP